METFCGKELLCLSPDDTTYMKTIDKFIQCNVPPSLQVEEIYVGTPTMEEGNFLGKYDWSKFYKTTYETLVKPGVLVAVYVSPSGFDYY